MPGSLYRRGGIWWGRIQRAGRDLRRSLRTRDRTEARRRLAAWTADIEHEAFYGENRRTWKEAVLRYTTEVIPRAVKPSTSTRYLTSLRQVDPYIGGLYLDQVDRRALADMISRRLKGAGATNATVRRDLTAVSRVLAACTAWGWLDENPARSFDRSIIRERRPPIVPPTAEELEAVIAACPPGFRELVRFAAETGMRMEEVASLEWPQVDLKRGEVTLYRTKTSRPRVVKLATLVADAEGTISGTPRSLATTAVFWHGDGRRHASVSSSFRRVVAKLDARARKKGEVFRRFRFHDLRHRFAIEWLKRGGDIYELSRHLGHTSVKTTEIYLGYAGREAGTNPGTGTTVLPDEREAQSIEEAERMSRVAGLAQR